MSEKYTVEVQQVDDCFIEIPPPLLEKLGWTEGDDLKFDVKEDGAIQIKKIKLESVELDFDDEELFKLMVAAHKKGVSFNEFCEEALEGVITKAELNRS